MLRLARLADDVPEVAELDLNPVLGLPSGCVAVDARVRVRPSGASPQREDLVAAAFPHGFRSRADVPGRAERP